jgi:hypothetical protein
MDAMKSTKRIWRAWLRMERGGLMGVPYPADNETRAQELAHKAEKCFGGTLLHVEEL